MNYASIRTCDIANGEGVRVSLFVSGCTHHCPGCFNPEAQDFAYGQPFTSAVEDAILAAVAPEQIAGLTLLGGEPMEPANQRALLPFLRRFRQRFGETKTVWVYTGCVLDTTTKPHPSSLIPHPSSLIPHPSSLIPLPSSFFLLPSSFNTEVTQELLSLVDVLVDGPFVEDLKDISLKFRGSSNQRILDLRKARAHG